MDAQIIDKAVKSLEQATIDLQAVNENANAVEHLIVLDLLVSVGEAHRKCTSLARAIKERDAEEAL